MVEEDVSDELMELMIEEETIEATLEELKKAFESGDIIEEDYKDSKREYEDKLTKIKKETDKLKRKEVPAEEPSLEAIEEEMSAKVEEVTEKPSEEIEGIEGEALEPSLEAIEEEMSATVEEVTEKPSEEIEGIEGEALEPSLEAIEEEMSAKVEEIVKGPEVEIKEIEEVEEAPLEQIENEIRSLRGAYAVLNVKREVSQSTLDMVKKNYDEGVIDEPAYNRLRGKYEKELKTLLANIEETNKDIASREAIIPKYKELSMIKSEYNGKINTLKTQIAKNNKELDFFKSRKLAIVTKGIDYVSDILQEMKNEEEKLRDSGVDIPDASTPKKYAKMIKTNKEILAELKATQGVLPTILDNLEKKRTADEMDNDTYLRLKSEYNMEKNKADVEIKKVEEKIKRIEKELEIYNKIDKSIESSRSVTSAMYGALKKIWIEDQIAELDVETLDLIDQEQTLEGKLESKLKKMNQQLDKLQGKIS